MKVYLVGGAVRDKLLGYPVKEKDWVVVGALPEQLLKKGYRQVGKDFPVFLHPETDEEYALARTERKQGHGYYGFACDYKPNVSLEEDLARRDLTINAMAMDEAGQLYDPYNGQKDLQARVLRHVSPAFAEDPVRVLRVARFAARFAHLGFKLAEETRLLIYTMVRSGELNHLVPERVWQEWQRSLCEKTPEVFITTLRLCGALKIIIPELDALFGVPNPPQYHAEIDSGIHTLNVLQAACKLTDKPIIRFAALVHDLGKAKTLMSKWPKHYDHEHLGLECIEQLCQRLRIPADFKKFAVMVCKYHLIIHRFEELNPGTIVTTLEKTDAFRRPALFEDLLTACEADAMGKKGNETYFAKEQWRKVLAECVTITAKTLVHEGFEGEKIKSELHKRRVNRLQSLI